MESWYSVKRDNNGWIENLKLSKNLISNFCNNCVCLSKFLKRLFTENNLINFLGKKSLIQTSPINSIWTFDTPYIVLGLWMVMSGVGFLGLSGPKAPMVLGQNNFNPYLRDSSIILWKPYIFIFSASDTLCSPIALRRALKWTIVSILWLTTILCKFL